MKELEKNPVEDCISRQAVNVLVDELARAISDERCCMPRGRSTGSIMQDILELPCVQSKTDLDKIREEISQKRKKEEAEIKFGDVLGYERIGTYEICLQIVDKYRREG